MEAQWTVPRPEQCMSSGWLVTVSPAEMRVGARAELSLMKYLWSWCKTDAEERQSDHLQRSKFNKCSP